MCAPAWAAVPSKRFGTHAQKALQHGDENRQGLAGQRIQNKMKDVKVWNPTNAWARAAHSPLNWTNLKPVVNREWRHVVTFQFQFVGESGQAALLALIAATELVDVASNFLRSPVISSEATSTRLRPRSLA